MRNKDTGEFELVVGDKQLLSGFFIGVLLLAVVFALGYVLGRGTHESGGAAPTIPSTAEYHPQPAAATAPAATPAVMNPDVGHPDEATPPVDQPPQPTTVPAKEAKQERAPAPAPVAAKAVPEDLPDGSFWQVLAGSHASAEGLLQSLKGQGFPVITRPGPNSLTLVWVGPYASKEALGKAKKQLEDAGITNLYKKP
jgi:cell division septation protein DedD